MTKKYYDDACDDLISQCTDLLDSKGYATSWSKFSDSMHVEGLGRKVDIGYEEFLYYASKKYDDAYYCEEKTWINDTRYISTGWRFDVDDFLRNEIGLNHI